MKKLQKFKNGWGIVNRPLSFKEMIRRSPGSISVLIAFIISDILVLNGNISQEQRFIIPSIVAIVGSLALILHARH
jgi:hypothetical protein